MLASCVMLTYNRRHLLPVAIACYLAQDWPNKELVVVDDGDDAVEDMFTGVPGARYIRTERFKTVGDKLNFACEQARGEVIVTWDDDDWYAAARISDQLKLMVRCGKAVVGYHTIVFFDGQRASQYRGSRNYAVGNSQVYRKEFWSRHRFPSVDEGYDNHLTAEANRYGEIVCSNGSLMDVARIHSQNVTGAKRNGSIGSDNWPFIAKEDLPAEFFAAIGAL
jgi:glycosyltransferase involved in cell wall biosynthesis